MSRKNNFFSLIICSFFKNYFSQLITKSVLLITLRILSVLKNWSKSITLILCRITLACPAQSSFRLAILSGVFCITEYTQLHRTLLAVPALYTLPPSSLRSHSLRGRGSGFRSGTKRNCETHYGPEHFYRF